MNRQKKRHRVLRVIGKSALIVYLLVVLVVVICVAFIVLALWIDGPIP